MSELTDAQVKEMLERAERATPGPWRREYDNSDNAGGGQWEDVGPARIWWPYGKPERGAQAANDCSFIAAAREDVPMLCRELLEARGLCREAAAVIREMEQNFADGKPGFSADFIDRLEEQR